MAPHPPPHRPPPPHPGPPPRSRIRRLAAAALVLIVTAAVAAAAGCRSTSTPHKFTWRTLSRGLTSGLTQPCQRVLRDEVSYLTLWAEHAAELSRPALPPAVDFTQEMVIVIGRGTQPTGGYLVEVVDVELRGRTLVVFIAQRDPQPGSMQVQVLTQPFQFIALPVVAGRVEFRTVREAGQRGGFRKARPGEDGARPRPPSPAPVPSPRGAATAS